MKISIPFTNVNIVGHRPGNDARRAASEVPPTPLTTAKKVRDVLPFKFQDRVGRRITTQAIASVNRAPGNDKEYVTINGKRYQSVHTLPVDLRNAFLKQHDPVTRLGLTDASVFYRVTEKKYIKDGNLGGNPESLALIANHLAIQPNPIRAELLTYANRPGLPNEVREWYQNKAYRLAEHSPVHMDASDLPDDSLNVAYGDNAMGVAKRYMDKDMMLVKMTLGDIRKAGGGEVFADVGALSNTAETLIVTLPKGRTVPVEIIEST